MLTCSVAKIYSSQEQDEEWPDPIYRKELSVKQLRSQGYSKAIPAQDEALRAPRPVVWIPKDELGIADDEILFVRRTHESIWINNEGASLDERGKLRLCGPPPVSSK